MASYLANHRPLLSREIGDLSSFSEPFLSAEQHSRAKGWSGEDVVALTSSSLLVPQEQFEFALTAVAEEVNAILRALPQ